MIIKKYFDKKGLPLRPALTFSDVSIVTKFSDLRRRSDLNNFRTSLGGGFFLNIPIVSANMDTVTDSRLAIALARIGGLGFIHQFFPIDARVREVEKVKRADSSLVEDPVTISSDATLGEAKLKMSAYGISSILVVDGKKLTGILTTRDYRFKTEKDYDLPVSNLMKRGVLVTGRPGMKIEEAIKIFEKTKVEKLPLVDAGGRIKGLITAKDILKSLQYPDALKDKKGKLAVGATIGVGGKYFEEAERLLSAGADALLIDTARAGSVIAVEAVKNLRKKFPKTAIIAGNIDNPEHVGILADAGADCIKVGIGPGARCKTRMVAGVGTPQIHAVASCKAVAEKAGVSIIADGGIKGSDDFAKALVAGADSVMIGSLFAGTDESPGLLVRKGNQLIKEYRGSASLEHQLDRLEKGTLDEIRNPEGESSPVPYAGSVAYVVKGLMDGLRSSMSYVGAHDIKEFQEKGEFLWVSNEGYNEGKPRI